MTDVQDKKETTDEPVRISKYDGVMIKHTVDDEVQQYFGKEINTYKVSHLHTDIKLLLGYFSAFVAGGAFLFEYMTSFNEAKPVVLVSFILFWLLQGMSWAYAKYVEKDAVFVGYRTESKSGKRLGILTVSSQMERYSPLYNLKLEYQDQVVHKKTVWEVKTNVASWFTEEGVLVKERLDKDLQKYLSELQGKAHID